MTGELVDQALKYEKKKWDEEVGRTELVREGTRKEGRGRGTRRAGSMKWIGWELTGSEQEKKVEAESAWLKKEHVIVERISEINISTSTQRYQIQLQANHHPCQHNLVTQRCNTNVHARKATRKMLNTVRQTINSKGLERLNLQPARRDNWRLRGLVRVTRLHLQHH